MVQLTTSIEDIYTIVYGKSKRVSLHTIHGPVQLEFESVKCANAWCDFVIGRLEGNIVKAQFGNQFMLINVNHVMIIAENYIKENSFTYFMDDNLIITTSSGDATPFPLKQKNFFRQLIYDETTWHIGLSVSKETIKNQFVLTGKNGGKFII